MSTSSASFRKIWSKLNQVCWQTQTEPFSAIKGRNSEINDPIWPVFKLVRDFIYVHLSCKFQEVPIKTEPVMVMTKSIRSFCSNHMKVTLRLMIQSGQIVRDFIQTGQIVRDFIQGHLICKFNEDLIKTEWVMLMTKSNRDFFSNQGDITLWLMIRSGQFPNLFEILFMSTLSASFTNIPSKLNELCWWQSQTEAFSAIKGT